MQRTRFGLILTLLCVTAAVVLADPDPPWADRAAWERVDVVPMPKRIRLTGRHLSLTGGVVVLGDSPSEQDRIGAKWINDHVRKRGSEGLPVTSERQLPRNRPLRIFVGTRQTCKAIDQAARDKLFRLGPGVPGKSGYVIQARRNGTGTDLLLGGADPVGALYACVTLAGLVEVQDRMVVLREAEIVDWPDYPTVTEDQNLYHPDRQWVSRTLTWSREPSDELVEAYVPAMKEHLDRLLRWKVSCFKAWEIINWRRWGKVHPKALAALKQVTDYAKARGIRSLTYAFGPFVGRMEDYPDAPIRCATLQNGTRWKGLLRCWSMDDLRRQTASRLAEVIRAAGITDIGFHDTDTGGFLSPAQWESRCDVCRKRWGDDFAAATINKHMIYYKEIKKAAPDCRIHFTLYPYNISVLTQQGAERYHVERYGPSPSVPEVAAKIRKRFADFWMRMTPGLPADVTFAIRENVKENVQRFHETVAPHGTFIWYKSGSEQWQTFFDESPRWIPTFYSGRDDVVYTVTLQTLLPLKAIAVREYAWNGKAPGAAPWSRAWEREERWRHAEPKGEIYTVVLPHLVRNVFGRRAAPEITEALSCNVAYNQIFDDRHRMKPVLTTYEKMQWQADEAEKGARALDKLFERFVASGDRLGMDDYASRRFVYLREVFHCCKWMAQARAQNLLAREKAKAGKLDEARAAIQRGRDVVAAAREDMKRLLDQRPADPIYNAPPRGNDHKRRWRLYTPVWGTDYGIPEKQLAQTEKELPALAAAGELSPNALRELAKRTHIHVAPASAPPEIDGRLDEPDWRRPVPVEALFVYPEQKSIARAHTRARFLRDDKTLYVGITCWMPANAPIRAEARERDESVGQDEHVELFLMPPHLKGGYVHLMINAMGSISDKRVTFTRNADGATVKKLEPEWDASEMSLKTQRGDGEWELEAAIPLAALGAQNWRGPWRVNVCRDFKGPANAVELSAIMSPGGRDFHDTGKFLRLSFHPEPAPPPAVQLAVAGFAPRTRTMDDRVATVAEFGLEARSSRILHNVQILAEAYDSSGRLHRKEVVKRLPHLVYHWRSQENFRIGFEREIEKGGVRLTLESDEARHERWARIGGWQGTPELGSLFSRPDRVGGADDFRSSPGLVGPCNLPSEVTPPGADRAIRILGQRRGTVEFWFKPKWQMSHRYDEHAAWQPNYTFLHSGVLRRDHPWLANQSAFVLFYDLARGVIHWQIRNRRYAGWDTYARLVEPESWGEPRWHHIACVWDHEAEQKDWMRLYVDGKRLNTKVNVNRPDRMGADKSVDLDELTFAIQLMSLNSGRRPAPGAMDELRISRTPRYTSDFAPIRVPVKSDSETTALYHFDGDLDGERMTEDGRRYRLGGVAGALELH